MRQKENNGKTKKSKAAVKKVHGATQAADKTLDHLAPLSRGGAAETSGKAVRKGSFGAAKAK